MNRDDAIKIAAGNTSMTAQEFGDDHQWALAVVARADALLVAMGDAKSNPLNPCEGGHTFYWTPARGAYSCSRCMSILVRSESQSCCAATEARVVAEIAAWLRVHDWHGPAEMIERGDWSAKESVR